MATVSRTITALLASALLAGFAAGQADAAGMDSFTDPAHDGNHLALDVARVSVASDDEGRIAFDISITNAMYLPYDGLLTVFIDSDRSATTGDDGDDFVIRWRGSTNVPELRRWTGTAWSEVSAPTLSGTFLHGARISINRRDLGNTEGFRYWIGTLVSSSGQHIDLAPDSANRVFDLKLPKPAPSQTSSPATSTPSQAPAPASSSSAATSAPSTQSPAPADTRPTSPAAVKGPIRAPQSRLSVMDARTTGRVARPGKVFGVGIQVQQDATGELVSRGLITCTARVAGGRVKLVGRFFDSGTAICGWRVPKGARGRLAATIRVKAAGATVTKRFLVRVG